MANYGLNEIEEFMHDDTVEVAPKISTKPITRKWREIENFKENQRLHRELLEYSQYGL